MKVSISVPQSVPAGIEKTEPVRADLSGRTGQAGSAGKANGAGNLVSLLASLKLPQDSLSRSIVSFARFFSLPLEPQLLAAFRRAALGAAGGSNSPGGEARVLGSAAAADKGIRLTEKALADYAAAIEGADHDTLRDGPERSRNRDGGEGGGRQEQSGAGNQNSTGQEDRRRHRNRPGHSPNPEELRRRVTGVLHKKPLLDFINRIPGKNSRWIVVPFTFSEQNITLHVSLRILVGRTNLPERLTVDASVKTAVDTVVDTGEPGPGRRWLISLETGAETTACNQGMTLITKVELAVFSGLEPETLTAAEKKRLGAELAKALGVPSERVFVRDDGVFFPDAGDDHLRSINKTV